MLSVSFRRHGRVALLVRLVAVGAFWVITRGVQAQSGMTLTVQLQDTTAQPIVGATVRLIDAADRTPIGAQVTTDRGRAVFPALQPRAVRVVVAGVLADGTPLHQVGLDADGIWIELPHHAWQMVLVTDPDGAVFPELSLAGAGAADGEDQAAITAGTFGSPATPTPTSERGRHAPIAPTGTALQPTATATTAAGGELALALGWLVALGVALGLIIVYGRRL